MNTSRFVLTALLIFALIRVVTNAPANAAVSCRPTAQNVTTCRVDQPVVTQPSAEYSAVRYQPGDDITVDAGGCVQTGGRGKTWKSYVSPSGDHSDRLYHGSIWLPGATNGLQRIGVTHQVFHVSSAISPALTYLRLGYEDDGYGDNGYYGHDDGTDDQCKNVGDAYVILTIVHHLATATAPPVITVQPDPLDLIAKAYDDNGFYLNTPWNYQLSNAPKNIADLCPNSSAANCTHQTVNVDTPDTLKDLVPGLCTEFSFGSPSTWDKLYSKQGHTNWSTGTYTGKIFFADHSGTDDDYDMTLLGQTTAGAPITFENDVVPGYSVRGTHVEYDSDETIDHFQTAWWSSWHHAVDNDDATAHRMVDGSDAVVVGLVGLDCVHDCLTEIHPAYALAMRVADHPAGLDRWAFFARNNGDEGMCSQNQHYLETPTLVIRLHAPPGATSFTLSASDIKSNDAAINIAVDQSGQDAILVVNMPSTAATERVNGTIDLAWQSVRPLPRRASMMAVKPPAREPIRLPVGTSPSQTRVEEPLEERLSRTIATVPLEQRLTLSGAVTPDVHPVAIRRLPGALAAFKNRHLRVHEASRYNAALVARYAERLDLICQRLSPVQRTQGGLSAQACTSIHARRSAR